MDVVLYICNPCIQDAEEEGSRVSLDHCLKNNKASLCILLFSLILYFRFKVEIQKRVVRMC